MRAVRARRAALVEWLTGFLALLAAVFAGFEVFVPLGAGFLVFCAEEAELAGAVVVPPFAEPPVDCAAAGRRTISQDNRTAVQREASRGARVGETMDLISSL